MQQLSANRTRCTGMPWKTTQQHKKIAYLQNMTSEEDEEESEREEICRITQIKILPDNNDHYGIELKTNETK